MARIMVDCGKGNGQCCHNQQELSERSRHHITKGSQSERAFFTLSVPEGQSQLNSIPVCLKETGQTSLFSSEGVHISVCGADIVSLSCAAAMLAIVPADKGKERLIPGSGWISGRTEY
jgi:hypothetical protein